jgi:hypothetical protein
MHGALPTRCVTPRTKGFDKDQWEQPIVYMPCPYASAEEGQDRQHLLYPLELKGQEHNGFVSLLCYCPRVVTTAVALGVVGSTKRAMKTMNGAVNRLDDA